MIGGLARLVHDIDWAEDLAQDALVAALEQWPQSGIPDNPGAWLTATAKHRAIDQLRRRQMAERRHDELGRRQEREQATNELDLAATADDDIGDDMLSLLFATCHPMLSAQARAALTLRLFGGLSTPEIARAFLVSEATMGQRVVRAKRTLAEARVPLEVPSGSELGPRLASVLEVIYLIFNEGYSATAGTDWMRPALCEDALRVGRILAELLPGEPEIHGLVALMEIQASRSRARLGPEGEPVLLLDQDRSRWDRVLIGRGLRALARAEGLGGALGRYALQAAIAACHARAGDRGADRLGPDRGALRRARPAEPLSGGGPQPGGGGLDGLRARAGARARRRAHRRQRAERLPPPPERPGRPAGAAGTSRGGARRASAGPGDDPERVRAPTAQPAGG